MARIIRHRRALTDLLEIWGHIAAESGEARATAYLRKIRQKIEVLAEQPGMGRSRDELSEGLRSLPVASHMIFYRPLPDGIEVVRVIHGKRDINAVFEDQESEDDNDQT
ncbi:MAG TPA: type II toxin-antitoxin system RelE/ParE family toxin [Chloroflexia bacterium]|nr:type II toxin-antitoxin system RelE/ParE family toxin [Chloroflexia bacterium]